MKNFHTYILTNKKYGVLYVGVTGNLEKRIFQHKNQQADSFTKKYNLNKLVYAELFSFSYEAIAREKQLKNWTRAWKISLIEKSNPEWKDLYEIY